MYCYNCGAALNDNAKYCSACGTQVAHVSDQRPSKGGGRKGYSDRINDPAFAAYVKNTNRWSAVFSLILAIAAVAGFYIYGETSSEMENPQALYIGLGIGGMFIAIATYTIISRKMSKTWDGVVVDKTVRKLRRRLPKEDGTKGYYIREYTEYAVVIRDEKGKLHRLTAEDDDTVFNYYKIGDHVRHHGGLNTYEKYDKRNDTIIFCNACSTLCDINDDVCYRCNCPLLK